MSAAPLSLGGTVVFRTHYCRFRVGAIAALATLATLIAAKPAHAEITPEAERIVDALQTRLGRIRTLTWRTTGTYGDQNATGMYVRGIGLRFDATRLYDADATEVYVLADRQLAIRRAFGIVVIGTQTAALPDLFFLLPLLDKAQLAKLGRLEAAPGCGASEQGLRLVREAPKGGRPASTEFMYRLPDYRLIRITSTGGWGGRATQTVTAYADAGGYAFPVRLRYSSNGYNPGAGAIADVKANEPIPESQLRPDLTGLLTQPSDLSATQLEAQLTIERDPLARAGLAYSLACTLQSAGPGATGAADRVQSAARLAVELAPDALAPRLLLGGIATAGKPDDVDQSIDELLRRFPQSRALIYQCLLWPRLTAGSWPYNGLSGAGRPPIPVDQARQTAWVERWLKDCPDSMAALQCASMLYQRVGDTNRMIEISRAFLAQSPTNTTLLCRLGFAEMLSRAGCQDEARTEALIVDRALAASESSPMAREVRRQLVRVMADVGELGNYTKQLETSAQTEPRNVDRLMALAEAYAAATNTTRALEVLEQARRVDPQDRRIVEQLASLRARQDDRAGVTALYEGLLPEADADTEEWVLPALLAAYRASGDTAKGTGLVARVLARPDVSVSLLQAMVQRGDADDQSEPIYRRLLAVKEAAPEERQSWTVSLAGLLLRQSHGDDALKLLEASDWSGANESVQRSVSDLRIACLRQAGRLESHVAELAKQVEAAGEDVSKLEPVAREYQSARKYAEAAALYTRLIGLDSRQAFYEARVECLQQSGAYSNCMAACEELFAKFPNLAANRVQVYIEACRGAGAWDKGYAAAEKYAGSEGMAAWTWGNLANTLFEAGQYGLATNACLKAVTLAVSEQERDRHRVLLARTYIRLRQSDEAAALLKPRLLAVAGDWSMRMAYQELVALYRSLGKYEALAAGLQKQADAQPDATNLLIAAITLTAGGDAASACRYYALLVKLKPKQENFDAWAQVCQQAGKPDLAVEALEQALAAFPDQRRDRMQGLLYAYRSAGKPDKALATAEAFATGTKSNAVAWSLYGEQLKQSQRWVEAGRAFDRALACGDVGPMRFEYAISRADLYAKEGRADDAERALEALAKTATHDYERQRVEREQLRISAQSGKLPERIAALEKAAAAPSPSAAALSQLLQAYQEGRRYAEAADVAGRLAKLDPSPSTYSQWVSALSSTSQPKVLAAAYEEFLTRFPDQRCGYLSSYADACLQAGDTNRAIALGREAVERNPRDTYACERLMQTCARVRAYDEALSLATKGIEAAVDQDQRDRLERARIGVMSDAGRHADAQAAAEHLARTTMQPYMRSEAVRALVASLKASGGLDQRIAAWEARGGELADWERVCLAAACFAKPDYPKAAAISRELIRRNPVRENYDRLVEALNATQDTGGVIETYKEMMTRLPDTKVSCLQNLMFACRNAGRLDDAIAYAQELMKTQPEGAYGQRELARLLREAKRYDQAAEQLRKSIEAAGSEQDRASLRLDLAETLVQAGQYDAAREALASVLVSKDLEAGLRSNALRIQRQLLQATGGWDAHVAKLEADVAKSSDADGLKQLATAYAEQRKYEAAAATYGRLVQLDPSLDVYQMWVSTLGNARNWTGQVVACRALCDRFPQMKAAFQITLSTACENYGDLEGALAAAKAEGVERRQGHASARIATLLGKLGRPAEAVPYQEEALRQEGGSDYLRMKWTVELAGLLAAAGDTAKAGIALETYYRLAAELGHQYGRVPAATNAFEVVLAADGEFVERLCRKASEGANDVVAQLVAAEACSAQGRNDVAVMYRRRAAELRVRAAEAKPDDRDLQRAAGAALAAAAEPLRAAACFERALALRRDADVYSQLASAYAAGRDYTHQAATLEALMEQFPNERVNRVAELVYACQNGGQADKALETLKKAVVDFPAHMDLRACLADLHARAGRVDEAVAVYRATRQAAAADAAPRSGYPVDQVALRIVYGLPQTVPREQALTTLRALREDVQSDGTKKAIDQAIERWAVPPPAAEAPAAEAVVDAGATVGDDVIEMLKAEAADSPANTAVLLKLASAYDRRKDPAATAEIMRRVVKLVSQEPYHLRLIRALVASGADAEAVTAYETFFGDFPLAARKHLDAYCATVVRSHGLQAALQRWTETVAAFPNDISANAVLKALDAAGQPAPAVAPP